MLLYLFICNYICYHISGGLAEEVDEKVLHAAFLPFGDIIDVQVPLDYETGLFRGLLYSIINGSSCSFSSFWGYH